MRSTVRSLESKVYNVKVCHAILWNDLEYMWSGPHERNLAKLRVANIIIPMFNLSNSEMTSFGKCIVCLVLGLTTYFYCGGEYYNTNTVSRRFYIFTNDWRLKTVARSSQKNMEPCYRTMVISFCEQIWHTPPPVVNRRSDYVIISY